MNSIVKKLSEIENAAVAIVEHAEAEKITLEKEIADRRKEFDDSLETETVAKLNEIRSKLVTKMEQELKKQNAASEETIRSYTQEYEERHEEYARLILAHITEVS